MNLVLPKLWWLVMSGCAMPVVSYQSALDVVDLSFVNIWRDGSKLMVNQT